MKITVLKQTHISDELMDKLYKIKIEGELSPEEKNNFNLIVKSQYRIAKYLEKHPNTPVIMENSRAIKIDEQEGPNIAVKHLLPNGVTGVSFTKLSFHQKRLLALKDGAFCSVHNKRIKQTYNDHPKLTYEELIKARSKLKNDLNGAKQLLLLDQMREYLAIENAIKIAEENNSKEVILIYGANHEFIDVQIACFPTVFLEIQDMSDLKSNKAYLDYMELLKSAKLSRPAVKCANLALAYDMSYSERAIIKNDTSSQLVSATVDETATNSTFHSTMALVGLAGLVGFGLFRCYSAYHKKTCAEIVVSANTNPSQNKNDSIKHKNQ